MKTRKNALLLFLAGILIISINPNYAQSLEEFMCDPDFWKVVQAKDIEQINEPDRICKNQNYNKTFSMPIFHVAALYASPEVLVEFLNKNSEDRNSLQSPTALQEYIERKHSHKFDINLQSGHREETVLHRVSENGRSEVIQILMDAGADPYIQDRYGTTALQRAAGSGHSEAVQILIDTGVNPDIKNKYGSTALHWAAARGHSEVVRILVNASTEPDIQNKHGQTALYLAAEYGRSETVQILIDAVPNLIFKINTEGLHCTRQH